MQTNVFVTGATGFVGSAVVQELIRAGHQVTGLARSDAAAKSLAAAGAKVHRGDLEDLKSLRRAAADSDGVIHTGFIHDFSKFKEVCETDRRVIEALGSMLSDSNRPLVITSGVGIATPGRLATEESVSVLDSAAMPRVASEEAAASVAARGVRVAVVRLPIIHGDGDGPHSFVRTLIRIAREKGVTAYVGDGTNRWPAAHQLDAAALYRLAFEKAPAGLSRFHAVAEEGIAFREIAEAIGRRLNLPVVSKSAAEAGDHFGWFAHFAGMDAPASSKLTRERLGWRPVQATLIGDLERGSYFKT
ncbi:MAG TPA: SDR family oxidoreductase [Verrucomicrobiae bacterium]|nr:SDR family oxidoreductase [Verrucomicrobiae bacterium]